MRALSTFLLLSCLCAFSVHAQIPFSYPCIPQDRTAEPVLTIDTQGFYDFSLEGERGATLSVIDRMYGRLGTAELGEDTSEQPKHFAALLEKGEYKLKVQKRKGAADRILVQRFTEKGAFTLENPGEIREFSLADREVISFTVQVDEANPRLDFLALGRGLGGMKLLREGGWVAGIDCATGTVEIEKGKPQTWCEYSRAVEPGTYTVLLWGAPELPWKSTETSSKLFVTQGRQRLDEIGLRSFTLGPSGFACFSVPGSVEFAQASLKGVSSTPSLEVESLLLASGRSGSSRFRPESTAVTDPKGAYRTATLHMRAVTGEKWLLVEGKSGQQVELRHFPDCDATGRVGFELENRKETQSSVRFLGPIEGEDSAPLSAWLYEREGSGTPFRLLAETSLELSEAQSLHLKYNLLSTMGFLVRVKEAGDYTVLEEDSRKAGAEWTLIPSDGFTLDRKAQVILSDGKSAKLEAGLYLLQVKPLKPGVIDALLSKTSLQTRMGGGSLWKTPPLSGGNLLVWPSLSLPKTGSGVRLGLAVADRGGLSLGLSVRSFPAELSKQSLSLFIEAGGEAGAEIRLDVPSALRFEGSGVKLSVDGLEPATKKEWAVGSHRLTLKNPGKNGTWILLEALPTIRAPLAEVPIAFEQGKPVWIDFQKSQIRRFLLDVKEGAQYSVSTTGRLATAISIRSPLNASLARDEGSGAGRNSTVSVYLRAGSYLVEVQAMGQSEGSSGVTIAREPVRTLPPLRDGRTVRATAESGEALLVPVEIEKAGTWSIDSLGLSKEFSYRLEDAGGWPVGSPRGEGSGTFELSPGTYRWISFSDTVSSLRVFSLALEREKPEGEGEADSRKVFQANLSTGYERSWKGTGPDIARLELPVSLEVDFSLDESMLFKLLDANGSLLESGPGGSVSTLTLPEGKSTLEFSPIIPDEDHAYTFSLSSPALFQGRVLSVGEGSRLPVVIGKTGNWEIATSGRTELQGALFAKDGSTWRLVTVGQRIENDWNCRLSARLEKGTYLAVFASPADSSLTVPPEDVSTEAIEGSSRVSLRLRDEKPAGSFQVPFTARSEIASEFAVFDTTAEKTGPCLFTSSPLPCELRLERDGRLVASGGAPLLAVLEKGARYRLLAGQSGDEKLSVAVSASSVPFDVRKLDAGGSLTSAQGAVFLSDAEPLSRIASRSDLRIASAGEASFSPLLDNPFPADGAWLATSDLSPLSSIDLSPVNLSRSASVSLPLPPNGQTVAVTVAKSTVALARVQSLGSEVSLSVRAPAVRWSSLASDTEQTLLGLLPGAWRLSVRDSVRGGLRSVPLSLESYPVSEEAVLPEAGKAVFTVAPRSALLFKLPSGKKLSLRLALEKGLCAFSAGETTLATVDASQQSTSCFFSTSTGDLEPSGYLCVINAGDVGLLSSCETSLAFPPPLLVTGEQASEGSPEAPESLSFRVDALDKDAVIVIAGAAGSARFRDDETGLVSEGVPVSSVAGTLTVIPGRKGLLTLELPGGWYRVSLAKSSEAERSIFGKETERRDVKLPSGSLLGAEAEGEGLLAVIDASGAFRFLAASSDGQSCLLPLPAGNYTILSRPFSGRSRVGGLSVKLLAAKPLMADIPAPGDILSPGEKAAYRIIVDKDMKVGLGVRAESEDLSCLLYSATMELLAQGPLLLEELPAGQYYLIVESDSKTVRYEPLYLGSGENR